MGLTILDRMVSWNFLSIGSELYLGERSRTGISFFTKCQWGLGENKHGITKQIHVCVVLVMQTNKIPVVLVKVRKR